MVKQVYFSIYTKKYIEMYIDSYSTNKGDIMSSKKTSSLFVLNNKNKQRNYYLKNTRRCIFVHKMYMHMYVDSMCINRQVFEFFQKQIRNCEKNEVTNAYAHTYVYTQIE